MTRKTFFMICFCVIVAAIWVLVIAQIIRLNSSPIATSHISMDTGKSFQVVDHATLNDPFSSSTPSQNRSGNDNSQPLPSPSVILKGISSDNTSSKAILALKDAQNQSKMLTQGENFDKVQLIRIESDHVVIRENGRLYRLYSDHWELEK